MHDKARICPLIDRECMGRDCAMAVLVDSANVSAYNTYWCCGLVANERVYNYGAMRVVAQMRNDEYRRERYGR